MIPSHASAPLESLERLLCRELSHRIVVETRADPVVSEFWLCTRCGKWGRL